MSFSASSGAQEMPLSVRVLGTILSKALGPSHVLLGSLSLFLSAFLAYFLGQTESKILPLVVLFRLGNKVITKMEMLRTLVLLGHIQVWGFLFCLRHQTNYKG